VFVAELQLSRADAEAGRLPRICMQCGAPATDEIWKKYTTDQVHLAPPPPEPIGCLILGPILGLLKLISWSTATTISVRTPLCHKHAHGWFSWSTLEAKTITQENIVLAGVSEGFVHAWEQQRPADRPPNEGVIRVRCRSCQSLNDEQAKFCGQCGAGL
jgi:hypothetical protein